MKIYILERDNPTCWEEPEVFINPDKAIKKAKEEYEVVKEDIGVTDENDGYGEAWCEWNVDEEIGIGDALIDRDIDGDRWQWRITEREI